jgi:tRNA(fMet)-specific endonuclease VapC
MNESLIDTDILSYFLKGDKKVVKRFDDYLKIFSSINISIITHFEIVSGLQYRKASKQLSEFEKFVSNCTILPVTKESSQIAAFIYADLRTHGKLIDDIDLLIAGIAIENNLKLVTNNEKHFKRIKELNTENWLR